MINYDVPLNARGNNANLRASLSVSNDTMLANGFVLCDGLWNYSENLGYTVTLDIYILCDTMLIDVIDEEFLQSYDYQVFLRNNNAGCSVPLEIHRKVQATMKRLSDAGIIEGWVYGDYI